MPTIKLIPSHYDRSNTSYVTVSDPANMYFDTSHTANYATLRGRAGRSSNSTYYAFINGFDFSQVPSGVTVTGFSVKIRCYRNQYENTGSSYRMRLASSANNSNVISGTTVSTDIGTTASVITIPTGSLTWAQLVSYGANFSIEIRLRNTSTSSSNYPYVYVYGAEIEVEYVPGDIYSNYYIMRSYGGWSPCVEGNNAYGLRPFSGSVLPNCSGWATGRFNERLGLNDCVWLGSYNGADFIYAATSQGLATGWDPVVGAILVWGDPGSEGHVAVVEQVIDNDHIVTSESGWNYTVAPIVRTVSRTRGSDGRWGYGEACKGFAYPPGVIPGQTDDDEEYYIMFMQNIIRG